MKSQKNTKPPRGSPTICISFKSEDHYLNCVSNPRTYREYLEQCFVKFPELFPKDFDKGFTFHAAYHSKKQDIVIRRIRLKSSKEVFQIRPSLLMPYLVARTEDVEKGLFLRRWGVPYDALSYVFGRDPMFWYRATTSLGRPSIVGTTIKSQEKLPKHLVADEKHTRLSGEKCFVPTVVAGPCILGASVVSSASSDDLEKGYGDFAKESREVDPDYSPETVCVDGWNGTWEAWRRLFPFVTIILCFLHSVLKVISCSFGDSQLLSTVIDKVWHVYEAETKSKFSQRIRRLREWTTAHLPQGKLRENVLKLCSKRKLFSQAYDFVNPYRTSNGVDRLMNFQDRLLYAMQYFHGTQKSARLAVRSMALLWNFHPYGARTLRKNPQRYSPFHDLNGFVYYENWLQNLLISSSLLGHRM
jgi:hypothetical protein